MEVDVGLLILRVVVGLTFAAHGAQKLFGWWGGPGTAGWHKAVEGMGFRPVGLFVAISIGAEVIGGLFLALGIWTPFAAGVLMAQAVAIIALVHWAHGFFTSNNGIEFPFALATVVTAVAVMGPGRAAIDTALGISFTTAVRLELLALGFAAGVIAVAVSKLVVRPAATASR
jgi:putative oxidoreductase